MIWPIEMLGWLTNGVASAKASIKRLNKIYAEMPDILDESKIEEDLLSPFDVAGSVKFNNVTYKAGERNILENVSFEIKKSIFCGWLLVFMNIALAVIILFMVVFNKFF